MGLEGYMIGDWVRVITHNGSELHNGCEVF